MRLQWGKLAEGMSVIVAQTPLARYHVFPKAMNQLVASRLVWRDNCASIQLEVIGTFASTEAAQAEAQADHDGSLAKLMEAA